MCAYIYMKPAVLLAAQRDDEAAVSGSIRALRQSGGALRQLQLRASGTLGSGVSTATATTRGPSVAIAGGGSMPRREAPAALLRASRDGWSGALGAGGVAGAGSGAGSGSGAEAGLGVPHFPPAEGPLDSLKAMASRIEGLGRGLMELAEGRPRSARREGGPITTTGMPPATADGNSQLQGRWQGEGAAGFRSFGRQLVDVRDGDADEEYGVGDDGAEEEVGAAAEVGEVLGFKSSLPPNPFGY